MESQSYGASPAIWDHTVLPATRHRWARPALTPGVQAGTRFTYPGGMEGWVYLVTRKRSRRESNSRPLGLESNALTTQPPINQGSCNFPIEEIWVLRILILQLNSHKMFFLAPSVLFLEENFPTRRKFSDGLKFRGTDPLPRDEDTEVTVPTDRTVHAKPMSTSNVL